MLNHYLTVREAAEELGLTPQQILNRIRRRKIRATKKGWVWFVPRREVERARGPDATK